MILPTRTHFRSLLVLGCLAALPDGAAAQCQLQLEARASAPDDDFGASVSIDGDTALIGAWGDDAGGNNSGATYVFERSGSSWIEQARLTASDAAPFDGFGFAVSVQGDTALIGAFGDDDAGDGSGAAYVFVRNGTTWSEQTKLTASDGSAGDRFGQPVSLDGDTVVIGADADAHAGDSSGSVYVFVRDGTVWSEQAKLTASDAAAFDHFSEASISGDTILVGASRDDDGGMDSGSAYVFVRSGTTWSEQAKLTASDAAPFDEFGARASLFGDTALIGAPDDDDIAGLNCGTARVFVRNGTTWSEQAKLTASDGSEFESFGQAVFLAGDTALVRAVNDDDPDNDSSSVYVFLRSGTTWSERAKLTLAGAPDFVFFGRSIGFSGDAVLCGAPAGGPPGLAWIFHSLPLGDTYCATSPNSVGPGMLLSALGTASRAKECLTLRADGGPDDKFGIFFFGPNQLAGVPFGEGLRCVGGTTQRIQPPAATGPANGNPGGSAIRALDLSLPYGAALTTAPPSTNFQYWYRDPMGGPAGFNTSDAIEIAFTP